MLQYPAFMRQYPWSTGMIPTSFLLPAQWPQPHNDDLLLAMEESDFEDKCSEIRKTNNNIIVIGKTTVDNDKEDYDNDVDDEEADNAEESEVLNNLYLLEVGLPKEKAKTCIGCKLPFGDLVYLPNRYNRAFGGLDYYIH
ncbi:uncharacterized protein LOC127789888 isoform X1 [Diospyros lotus]|uniref:uncharacterized protein LOC127789888 isoform X1 n=1 Tax=Diospyros lotus TaxID=55363 RepID=UPI0022578027|nr:uncharacterized protein LOC127789888 isoform X1 [Diospyros lotus]